jgi:peptidoglycan/xylan/chitin deacetylase (PgdA/CDA1 family)
MLYSIGLKKKLIAALCYFSGFSWVLLFLQKIIYRRNYIRAVHYHGTGGLYAASFERQIKFYSRHFSDVNLEDLRNFLKSGHWHKPKPGLIISFDDGIRSNFLYAAPILQCYGFTGWFFVPTSLIATFANIQVASPKKYFIICDTIDEGQLFMTWDDIHQLDRHHVIGSHTRTHWRLNTRTTQDRVLYEVFGSKRDLEEQLRHSIDCFSWVGGEETSYSAEAAQMIVKAGYQFSFMTDSRAILPKSNPMQLYRTQIEANWPLYMVNFQLSGIMDVKHLLKRRRINRRIFTD